MQQGQQKNTGDYSIVQRAIARDTMAQRQINEWVRPYIEFLTNRFCKRYCKENKFRYRCTVPQPWPSSMGNTLYCEWGNASYAWMLEELVKPERLRKYESRNGAPLRSYLYVVANSRAFYERWKDWRFARRVHVPEFIKNLHINAEAVFHTLRSGGGVADLSAKLGMSGEALEEVSAQIISALVKRGKLHLLERDLPVSLDSLDGDAEPPAIADSGWLDSLDSERLRAGLLQLNEVERFVLETMVVDGDDAESVAETLRAKNITWSEKYPAQTINAQQVYYFKRKCLVKLAKLAGFDA